MTCCIYAGRSLAGVRVLVCLEPHEHTMAPTVDGDPQETEDGYVYVRTTNLPQEGQIDQYNEVPNTTESHEDSTERLGRLPVRSKL